MTDPLTPRIQQAAESLLDNETLTENLDEASAGVLLDWGLELASAIAQATRDLDDLAAETFTSPKLRALRLFLRQVNQWTSDRQIEGPDRERLLSAIVDRAASVYPDYHTPDPEKLQAFLQQAFPTEPSRGILNLRQFIESERDAGLKQSAFNFD